MSAFQAVAFRAAPGTRAMASPHTVTLLALARLDAADSACWDRLAEQAATASIFARPWFVRQSLRHFDPGGAARLALVRDANGPWLGVMPLAVETMYGRAPMPHWAAWRHANHFIGTPLVRKGSERAFWKALLRHLDSASPWRMALRLFDLPVDDPVNRALFELCRDEGRPLQEDRRIERAKLLPGSGEGGANALKPKERRRLASLRRKLEREVGPVEVCANMRGEDIPGLCAQFLALEDSGWKGRSGSSLSSAEDTRAFFGAVAAAAAREGALDVLSLKAGGRTVAMSTHFIGEQRGFGFKMAYDEAFATYAPGLLLLDELTRRFAELGINEVDSCSAPGQQPISRLWPERRELVEGCVALGGPMRRNAFRLLGAVQDLRGRVRGVEPADA